MSRSRIERAGTAHGLDYVVLALDMGHRCGYVRVPDGHPWHGLDYAGGADGRRMPMTTGRFSIPVPDHDSEDYIPYEDQIQAKVRVHGGVTYAGEAPHPDCAQGWWFGFACAHHFDATDPSIVDDAHRRFVALPPGEIRIAAYVAAECESLAEQLAAVGARA